MAVITRPSMTDDSGTFTDGTEIDKALVDAVCDQVDDQVHSTTNPTIKPKAITDEVVTARGNLASLNARISGVVDANGSPVAAAGQATETQLARAEGNVNLVLNGDLEDWAAGGAAAPDHFALSGAGAAVARTGPAMGDTTDLGTGTYAAKITSGAGAAAKLTQQVITAANYSKYRSVDGRKVGFTIRAKVANSNVLRVVVDDGATTTTSAYATGSVNEQDLSVVHTISASATKLDVYAEVALGAGVAYVGGFTTVFSDIAPSAWNPLWAKFRQDILDEAEPETVKIGGSATVVSASGTVYSAAASAATSGTGETVMHTTTIPAGLLSRDGDRLKIYIFCTLTADGNAKTYKLRLGSTDITLYAASASHANVAFNVTITRRGATSQYVSSDGAKTGGGFATPVSAAMTETLANALTLETRHTHATGGTTTEEQFDVEYLPVQG